MSTQTRQNPSKPTFKYLRAECTADVLQLNRDLLTKARESVYHSYRDSLAQYVSEKNNDASEDKLAFRRNELNTRHHPTVWREMIRSHAEYPTLAELFYVAPELLLVETIISNRKLKTQG